MNIYITLDYEVYFGTPGTVQNCIVRPMEDLQQICEKHGVSLVLFVDAGYLKRLKELKNKHASLQRDWEAVTNNLKTAVKNGHSIQLHIHPHWEDCTYDGTAWQMDLSRYRLADFSEAEVEKIFIEYKAVLEEFAENPIFAYRAGGWCIQPFTHLKKGMQAANIDVDSTVFYGGYYQSGTHFYNFRNAPFLSRWQFEDAPVTAVKEGTFTEIPIASYRLMPSFFWKFIIKKFQKSPEHSSYGDGKAAPAGKASKLRQVTLPSWSVVSIDGYKASFLQAAYQYYQKKGLNDFVIIGHPKAFTPYSLKKLDSFLSTLRSEDRVITFSKNRNHE